MIRYFHILSLLPAVIHCQQGSTVGDTLGLYPLPELSVNDNAFLEAASKPNTTAMVELTTGMANKQILYYNITSSQRSYINLTYSTPAFLRTVDYRWNQNISNVVLQQPNYPSSAAKGWQANAISELVYSKESITRINSANRTLAVFGIGQLPDNVTAAGQNDDGSCVQTLGIQCIQELLSQVTVISDTFGLTVPISCQRRIGNNSWGATSYFDLHDSVLLNTSLSVNSANPTSQGYYVQAAPRQSNGVNRTFIPGGIQANTRSLYLSRVGPVLPVGNDTGFNQLYWQIRPHIVLERPRNGSGDIWASMTCLRGGISATFSNSTTQPPTYGKSSKNQARVGAILMILAATVVLV